MAPKNYGQLERRIIEIFEGSNFELNGKNYSVDIVGKPTTARGECKTDVYVLAKDNSGNALELKISVKSKGTNEFQENKVSSEKAEVYFGEDWQDIIKRAALSLKDKFESCVLINIPGKHPVKPNSILLGWKLEIASKARKLSTLAPLTIQEIKDYVYKGTNQAQDKKNAYVKGAVIPNSGVADYLLEVEVNDLQSAQDVVSKLELIETKIFPETHLIFTANNYRTDKGKSDGPRPLAVYLKWSFEGGKLKYDYIYDSPLAYKGQSDIQPVVQGVMENFGFNGLFKLDLNREDIDNPELVLFN
jgi:hypothetical protein